jgi:hypothetical protein
MPIPFISDLSSGKAQYADASRTFLSFLLYYYHPHMHAQAAFLKQSVIPAAKGVLTSKVVRCLRL